MLLKQLWHATAPGLAWLWRRFPSGLQVVVLRCLAPSYVVGVSAVCLDEQHQALLLEHRFSKPDEHWGLPGGLLGRNENPVDGIRREILEETGLHVENLTLLDVSADTPFLNITFLCYVTQSMIRLQTTEVTGWQWCDPATVDLPMREHHRQALRLVAQQVYPSP